MAAGGVGALVEPNDARVSAFDHGVTVGDGVFETIKVVDGTPLALTRHLHRLTRSCDVLGLATPDSSSLKDAVSSVIASQVEAARLARLRITVTAGLGPLGSDRGAGEGTTIVALASMDPWPATTSAIVVPWVRNERSAVVGAKTTSYAENVVALRWARERGFSEGLFMNSAGNLSEGTGTNVFVVIDGQVVTPGLNSGCLAGITRELILEWGMAVEGELHASDLENADEVFLTSSTRDIHPVLRLSDRQWEAAGKVSRALSAQYVRRITQDVDP
ncbi:MAG: 4-amino-4-deoxychorismate lyase, partial [Actinomycetales bacterium]|nr:4-amino-4-deoxychorismate lyase [Actinomycetales bacterium]